MDYLALGKDAVDTGAVEKGGVVGISELVVVLARLRLRQV